MRTRERSKPSVGSTQSFKRWAADTMLERYGFIIRIIALGAGHHGALFCIFWKLTFWNFKKFQSKILEVAIDIFYGHAKSQREIICISAYTKMRNTNQLRDFRIMHCSPSQIWKFIFFTQSKIHNISGWFFAHRYKSWLSTCMIFFWFFWNFKMSISNIFKKQAPWCMFELQSSYYCHILYSKINCRNYA
jgi:hypothetical protein